MTLGTGKTSADVHQVLSDRAARNLTGNTSPPSQLVMFSPSFARALRSTGSASTVPVSSLCRAALATNPTPFRPSHQRRYSSSKSSIPPSSKKKSGEELERNAATQLQGKQADAKPIDKVTEIPLAISTNNAPHVSPTTHRHGDGR
jgi:hypothetical protein